jgi:crossover junction endodeoxyribonuclease RuvC
MKLLGIDPGTRVVGWGLIEAEPGGLRPLAHGVIQAGRDGLPARLVRVFDGLEEVLQTYAPDEVAIENVFVSLDPRATIALGEGRGVAILAAAREGRPIFQYTPAEVKKCVAGNGRASKPQIQRMVRVHLGMEEVPRPFDAADALAVAICHARRRRFGGVIGSRSSVTVRSRPVAGASTRARRNREETRGKPDTADLLFRRRRSSRAVFTALAERVGRLQRR